MIFTIKKGHHRAWPLSFGLWFNRKHFAKNVFFFPSCKYSIPGEDMMDTNKLFGFGYMFNHHVNSARFGWRYNPATNKILVSAYCYDRGKRIMIDLCELRLMTWYRMQISVLRNCYVFDVVERDNTASIMGQHTVGTTHKKKWQFKLGVFFGGNKPAPNTMKIEMKPL